MIYLIFRIGSRLAALYIFTNADKVSEVHVQYKLEKKREKRRTDLLKK